LIGALKIGTDGLTLSQKISNGVTNLRTKILAKSNLLSKLRVFSLKLEEKAIEQQTKAEEKGAKRSMAAGILKAIGGIIGWLGKGPVGWAIAAASIAAIVAIGGAIVGISASNKKQAAAEEAENEQLNETANKSIEEANANKEKLNSYEELYAQYQKTGENREEMLKAAKEIAEAYKIEGTAALALAGDYKTLNEKIEAARIDELNKV
jgi:hypothetical protein